MGSFLLKDIVFELKKRRGVMFMALKIDARSEKNWLVLSKMT